MRSTNRVRASEQVVLFLRNCAPARKKGLKKALEDLANNKGDIKPLEGSLAGFYRLRVGRIRVIYCYRGDNIDCIFAEERSIVYEVFEEVLRGKLTH